MPIPGLNSGGFFQQPQPNVKVLASGELTNAFAAIYTVPKRTQARVSFGSFFNMGAAVETVEVQAVSPSAVVQYVGRAVLNPNEFMRILDNDESLELSADWVIKAKSTNNTAVDYVLTGVELFLPTGG